MIRTQIYLTEDESMGLKRFAKLRKTSQSELIRQAIDELLRQGETQSRKEAFRKARGIWKDRTDLPDFEELRRDLDRYLSSASS